MQTNNTSSSPSVDARKAIYADAADESEYTIDLIELARACLAKWYLIIIVMVICAVILGGINKLFLPHRYQADSSLYISTTDSVTTVGDIQISALVTEDYESIIKSRSVLDTVISNLSLDMDYKALSQCVTVSNPSNTHIIEIYVTTQDIDESVRICNEILNLSADEIYKVIGTGKPSILDTASAAHIVDVKSSAFKYAVIGALIGLIATCAIIIIRVLRDTTIKSAEDIERYTGLPVLASVPVNKPGSSGKYGYGYGYGHRSSAASARIVPASDAPIHSKVTVSGAHGRANVPSGAYDHPQTTGKRGGNA